MTIEELAALVTKMRILQKTYFKTRDRQVLIDSKACEREVDAVLDQIKKGDVR